MADFSDCGSTEVFDHLKVAALAILRTFAYCLDLQIK
jgi:hypothetical protein